MRILDKELSKYIKAVGEIQKKKNQHKNIMNTHVTQTLLGKMLLKREKENFKY